MWTWVAFELQMLLEVNGPYGPITRPARKILFGSGNVCCQVASDFQGTQAALTLHELLDRLARIGQIKRGTGCRERAVCRLQPERGHDARARLRGMSPASVLLRLCNGDITSHYSVLELAELLAVAR